MCDTSTGARGVHAAAEVLAHVGQAVARLAGGRAGQLVVVRVDRSHESDAAAMKRSIWVMSRQTRPRLRSTRTPRRSSGRQRLRVADRGLVVRSDDGRRIDGVEDRVGVFDPGCCRGCSRGCRWDRRCRRSPALEHRHGGGPFGQAHVAALEVHPPGRVDVQIDDVERRPNRSSPEAAWRGRGRGARGPRRAGARACAMAPARGAPVTATRQRGGVALRRHGRARTAAMSTSRAGWDASVPSR